MMWSSVVAAVFIALLFTLVLVSLLGWRRPGAMQTESVVTSGVFFFMILVLATWAAGSWMAPHGPIAFGVPWLAWMGVALVVTAIVGAVTQPWDRNRGRRELPPATAGGASGTVANEMAGVGFGLAFWALVFLLLAVAIAGSYDRL